MTWITITTISMISIIPIMEMRTNLINSRCMKGTIAREKGGRHNSIVGQG